MKRFVFLLLILMSANVYASQVDEESARLIHMVPESINSDAPAELRFHYKGEEHVLQESDGGLVLATLYAMSMSPLMKEMQEAKKDEAEKKWNRLKQKRIPAWEEVLYLLPKYIDIYFSVHGKTMQASKDLDDLKNKLSEAKYISYKFMFKKVGGWLRLHVKSLSTYKNFIFKEGVLTCEADVPMRAFHFKGHMINPVCAALRSFVRIEKFETPYDTEKAYLVFHNPEALIKGFAKASKQLAVPQKTIAVRKTVFDPQTKQYIEVIEQRPVDSKVRKITASSQSSKKK